MQMCPVSTTISAPVCINFLVKILVPQFVTAVYETGAGASRNDRFVIQFVDHSSERSDGCCYSVCSDHGTRLRRAQTQMDIPNLLTYVALLSLLSLHHFPVAVRIVHPLRCAQFVCATIAIVEEDVNVAVMPALKVQ